MVFQQEAPSDIMADHEREIRILQYDRQYNGNLPRCVNIVIFEFKKILQQKLGFLLQTVEFS
jgi:hypothetical protein